MQSIGPSFQRDDTAVLRAMTGAVIIMLMLMLMLCVLCTPT
jgi:hypothetical protein